MIVTVNGKSAEVPLGATVADAVADAVAASGHAGGTFGIAVALNGEVVARASWQTTELSQDDRIEVLVAAQGG